MSLRKAGEAHHNTPEEVTAWLAGALDAVREAEIDDDLRAVAFGKAYDSLAAKQINYEVVQGGLMSVPRQLG